jgi:hypothetical protein
VSLSIKDGGDQIEYEDQDPRIHPLWLKEMAIHGGTPKMQKYFPTTLPPRTVAGPRRNSPRGAYSSLASLPSLGGVVTTFA